MIRLSRSVLAVGGVVLAAGLIGMTNPKTVHAVAAALVQVTNTASNPVMTQGVGQQAGQIVNLYCGIDQPCSQASSTTGKANGLFFTVPSGKSFVATSVDISPLATCSVNHNVALLVDNDPYIFWNVPPYLTQHFVFPSGLVYAAGTQVNAVSGAPACGDQIFVNGYLTAS